MTEASTSGAFIDQVAPGLLAAVTDIMLPTLVDGFNTREEKGPVTIEEVMGWLDLPPLEVAPKAAPKPRAPRAARATAGGTQCDYFFTKGDNKDQQCPNMAAEGKTRCNRCAGRRGTAPKAGSKQAVSASKFVSGMPARTAPPGRTPAAASDSKATTASAPAAVGAGAATPARPTMPVRSVTRPGAPRATETKVAPAPAPEPPADTGSAPQLEQLPDGRFVDPTNGFVFDRSDKSGVVVGRESEDQSRVDPLTPEDRKEATELGLPLPVEAAAKPRPAPVSRSIVRRVEPPAASTSATAAKPAEPVAGGAAPGTVAQQVHKLEDAKA